MNDMLRRIVHRVHALVVKGGRDVPPLAVEKAEECFYINYLQPGMTVFDVGANVGELSLLFSRFVGTSGKVHAFEALEETFERLRTVITSTGRSNLILNNIGVADVTGARGINVYDRNHSGWTTFAVRPLLKYGIDMKPVRQEMIKTVSIDDYCHELEIPRIDLLKIDVEGAEYQVLRGAEKMLREKRVAVCVFEFGQTTFDMGNDPAEIARFMKQCGYSLENIVNGQPVFPGGEQVETAHFSMHICRPLV